MLRFISNPHGLDCQIERVICMMIMTVVMKVRPEKQKEFLQAMRFLDSDRKKEKGFRKATLQEINNQNAFIVIHEWETQKDLGRYLGTENFKVLLGALRILCTETDIRYVPFRGKSLLRR